MSVPERERFDFIEDDFRHLLILLQAVPTVQTEAMCLQSMIDSESVTIEVCDPWFREVSDFAIDFQLRADRDGESLRPVVCIDPIRYRSFGARTRESEGVRSVVVAAQYPDGYDRSIRDIYAAGLERQRSWLSDDPRGVFLDPRVFSDEQILRRMHGDRSYFGDFDFDDWTRACDDIRSNKGTHFAGLHVGTVNALIEGATHSKYHFLLARAQRVHAPNSTTPMAEGFTKRLINIPLQQLQYANARKTAIDYVRERCGGRV